MLNYCYCVLLAVDYNSVFAVHAYRLPAPDLAVMHK